MARKPNAKKTAAKEAAAPTPTTTTTDEAPIPEDFNTAEPTGIAGAELNTEGEPDGDALTGLLGAANNAAQDEEVSEEIAKDLLAHPDQPKVSSFTGIQIGRISLAHIELLRIIDCGFIRSGVTKSTDMPNILEEVGKFFLVCEKDADMEAILDASDDPKALRKMVFGVMGRINATDVQALTVAVGKQLAKATSTQVKPVGRADGSKMPTGGKG